MIYLQEAPPAPAEDSSDGPSAVVCDAHGEKLPVFHDRPVPVDEVEAQPQQHQYGHHNVHQQLPGTNPQLRSPSP